MATFVVSLAMLGKFDRPTPGTRWWSRPRGCKSIGLQYLVGIDGISLWMVLLTTFLFPLVGAGVVEGRARTSGCYMASMLVLETAVLGSFVALDLLLFFVFFEAILVPMYLIIGGWGGERRVYAAVKFFLYTMAGSAFLLVAILFLYSRSRTRPGHATLRHPRSSRRGGRPARRAPRAGSSWRSSSRSP